MATSPAHPAEELYRVLAEADALETFRRLPLDDQNNFARWIRIARDEESYWRRVHALILAMRSGLLDATAPEPASSPRTFG